MVFFKLHMVSLDGEDVVEYCYVIWVLSLLSLYSQDKKIDDLLRLEPPNQRTAKMLRQDYRRPCQGLKKGIPNEMTRSIGPS